jgi:hypothetical protein
MLVGSFFNLVDLHVVTSSWGLSFIIEVFPKHSTSIFDRKATPTALSPNFSQLSVLQPGLGNSVSSFTVTGET